MAALILADRSQDGEASASTNGAGGNASAGDDAAAAALETAAERILALASNLSSH